MAEPSWVTIWTCQEETYEEVGQQQVIDGLLMVFYRIELIKSVTTILKELTEDDVKDMWCRSMRKYI